MFRMLQDYRVRTIVETLDRDKDDVRDGHDINGGLIEEDSRRFITGQ